MLVSSEASPVTCNTNASTAVNIRQRHRRDHSLGSSIPDHLQRSTSRQQHWRALPHRLWGASRRQPEAGQYNLLDWQQCSHQSDSLLLNIQHMGRGLGSQTQSFGVS